MVFAPFLIVFAPFLLPIWGHVYVYRVQIGVLSRAPASGSGMLRSVIESVNGTAFLGVIRDSWAFVLSQVPKSEGPGAPSAWTGDLTGTGATLQLE